MSSHPDIDGFIDEYVIENEWDDSKDPDTLRENAQKYSVNLRGANGRMGWFEWLEVDRGKSADEATTKDVKRFLSYLRREGLGGVSRTQARSGISQYYQLMDVGCPNPVEGLDGSWHQDSDKAKATGDDRMYLEEDDIQALIDNVPTPTLLSELIVKTLYQTGVRRMELATMELNRIDLEEREIEVYGEKTDEWRTVTFQDSLRTLLDLWIDGARKDCVGYHDDNPYLFPSLSVRAKNDHISGQTIWKTVVEAAENAGIQDHYGEDVTGNDQNKITPHTLRHSFAVAAAENGVPAPHLKTILGHHSLDITQIYTDIAGADATEMMKNRGPSLS